MRKISLLTLMALQFLVLKGQAQEIGQADDTANALSPKLMWDSRDSAANDQSIAVPDQPLAKLNSIDELNEMQKIEDRQRWIETFLNTTSVPVPQGQISASALRTHQFKN